MCDLIDLNSPDRKGLLSSRLASPLIPVPTDIVCSNSNTRTNDPRSLIVGKRDSLENNPFDTVLHKTTEYIQKKDDPFEVTLEKAIRLKCKKNTSLRTCSLDLTEDCIPKQKPHREKFKLNKTLDESLFNEELNQKIQDPHKGSNNNVIEDSNSTNMTIDVIKPDIVLPSIDVQDAELSILSQSVLNDTLFEIDKESTKSQIKSTLQNNASENIKKDKIMMEQIPISTATLKVPKLRRSFSQGETLSPKKSQYLNQISLLEPVRIGSDSTSIISSCNSFDVLNEGFLKSHCSASSVFSSLSNISSIPGSNSVSSTINSSLMLSNGTINRTFLESCSSDKSEYGRSSENMDLNKEIKSLLPGARKSITSVANVSIRTSMSDLTERFNKLKAQESDIQISESLANSKIELTCSPLNDIQECVTVMEKDNTYDVNNKLIDVDVFTLENSCSKEICKNSISDTSSDSVFIEGSKINKSILQEAKHLAKTFEELAFKTSSGSSTDDLITSNPLWTSELLPAFDDETSVDNLIELPVSPDGSTTNSKNMKVAEDNISCTDKGEGVNNKVQDKIKELEMELVEPISTGKRLPAATLLLDLKKIIKAENNVEANKLLENLEKALGINCESNTELLATYLSVHNNLEKSPQKSDSSLKVTKNVVENNMEHSHENNLSNDSVEDINFNDVNSSKYVNDPKYLKGSNIESKCETSKTERETEKMKNEKLNTANLCTESATSNEESNNFLKGKVVIELLTNIGKLLSEQAQKHPTLDILKNLGNVINFASNNCHADEDRSDDSPYIEIQQTPKKSKSKLENKTNSSILSKSTNRLSLDLESKKQPSKNFIRRTISVSQTPPHKNEPTSLMSTSKSTSQLREIPKRFPSDPNVVSPTANKKIIINNHKNELQKEAQTKPVATSDVPRENSSRINIVKNKLKKKLSTEIVNKKGPIKAILPVGSMQKREAISKKIPMVVDTVTPPKSHKIISSTPNSTNTELAFKKSRSSKPVASSTPDAQNSKARKIQSQPIISPKKRNVSCDISPVTIRINVNNNGTNKSPHNKIKSPRRHSKLPSPKKTTPKRQTTESGIPKSQTPPVQKRLNSSFDVNQYERMYESPQRSFYKTTKSQKNSPIAPKINENTQRSPLRDNNKLTHKVKPTNLISKLRRHSVGTNVMEKENNHI